MIGLSLTDKFRSLDIYRKLPGDIVQPTFSGALCKIIIVNLKSVYYK